MLEFELSEKLKQKIKENPKIFKLDNLQRCDSISIEESKLRRFSSYKEMIKCLKNSIRIEAFKLTTDSQNFDPNKQINATSTMISNAILSKCDIACIRSEDNYSTLYIYNPETELMDNSDVFLKRILTDISHKMNDDASIIINDINKMMIQVFDKIAYNSSVRKLQEVPSNYIIFNNNVVFDLNRQMIIDIDEISDKYDIVNKNDIDFIMTNLLSEKEKIKIEMYKEIINRIMKDWSNNDEQIETLMWQVMFSVLRNDNLEKYIIIKGNGGNGKSTYMMLLSKFAGSKYTRYINIHQFNDHNAINSLDMSVKVVIGDDAATNHVISDYALSNLKSIISSKPISVQKKYSQNVIIQTKAVFIQGTNTDFNMYENNNATNSRFVVIPWSALNFRENKPSDITFNLNQLIEDKLFVSVWATECLLNTKPFNKYIIPDVVREETKTMIDSSDTVYQFLSEVIDSIDGYQIIPVKILYDMYINWSREINPSSKVMKLKSFTTQLETKQDSMKFTIDKRRSRFSKLSNIKSLIAITKSSVESAKLPQQSIEFNNFITDEELNKFKHSEHPKNRELTEREIQMVYMLTYDHQNSFFRSLYQDYT